jgi:hypothetical protein
MQQMTRASQEKNVGRARRAESIAPATRLTQLLDKPTVAPSMKPPGRSIPDEYQLITASVPRAACPLRRGARLPVSFMKHWRLAASGTG